MFFFYLCVFESFLRRKTRHPKASTTLNDFRSSGAKGGRLLPVCFQNYDLTCLGSHVEKTPLVRTWKRITNYINSKINKLASRMSVEITSIPKASEGFSIYIWKPSHGGMESQAISMDIMIKLSAKGLFSIIFKQGQWKITIHVHLSIRQVRVKENTTTSKWIWFHISRNPQGSVPRTVRKGWPSSSEGRGGLSCEWSPSFRFWITIQLMVQKCG